MSLPAERHPAYPGGAISVAPDSFGSIACVVLDRQLGGLQLLTALHVLTVRTGRPVGVIARPPGPPRTDLLQWSATVSRVSPLRFSPAGFPNRFEVGLAAIDAHHISPQLARVGPFAGVRRSPTVGLEVIKSGAASQSTSGVVVHERFRCAFHLRDHDGTTRRAGFQQQLLVRHHGPPGGFSVPGDSGSAVVDHDRNLVGVIVGSVELPTTRETCTVVSPIEPILQAFDLTLVRRVA